MALRKLPKQYHPDFRLPRRKPTGGVEIDKNNWFGQQLDFYEGFTEGRPCNLVDGRGGTLPTTTNNFGVAANEGKVYSRATRQAGQEITYSNNAAMDLTKPYVIAMRLSAGSVSNKFGSPAVFKTSSTRGWSALFNGAGNYQPITFGVDGVKQLRLSGVAVSEIENAGYITIIFVFKGGDTATTSNYAFYLNGIERTLVAGSNVGNIANNTFIGGETVFNSTDFLGDISFVAKFSGVEWGAAEAKAFTDNPYQILKPKQALIYFTSDAGGSTPTLYPSFIPSAEEFYTASVENMLSVIEPNFITTQESVYNPEVSPQGVTILPDYIPSEEVVYSPAVEDLLQVLSPDFIPTEETVYSPEVERLLQLLYPSYIESEETTYSPTVTGGDSISIPLTDRRTWNAVAQYLRDLVFTGQDNDVIQKWFISEGYEGEYNENWNNYLADQGYTDGNLSDRYSAWRKQ